MSFIRKISQIIFTLFFYAIFTLAIFWNPIVNKFGAIQWDAISVHFFNLLFSSQAWHNGQFPLWTPYIFNGFPQIADLQVALFYPVNLIVSFFSVFTPELMQYQLIFHYFLAGFFAFLFTRYLSGNFIFALGGGLIYAFSGFMVGHGSHVGMQNTAVWLPLIFLFLMRALEENRSLFYKKIGNAFFCGFFLGIAILAGHFQMALYTAFAVGFYFAFDFIWTLVLKIKQRERGEIEPLELDKAKQYFLPKLSPQKQNSLRKKIAVIAVVYIMAVLISSIQLFPTFELTKQSLRAKISLEMSQTESLNPDSLKSLFNYNYNNVAHGGQYTGPWDRTQNYLYITVTAIFLAVGSAVLGIFRKESKKITIFFLILATISIIYSFGQYGFLQKYFYQFIPFFDKIRAPSNMMLLFDFAVIGLAATFINILSGQPQIIAPFSNVLQNLKNSSRLASEKFNAVPVASLRPLFSLAKLLNFLRTFAMFSKVATIWALFLLLILIVISAEIFNAVLPNELLYARKKSSDILQEPWIAQNILSEYSALDEIDKFKVFKIPEFSDNSTQMRKIYAFDGYNPLALARYGNFVDVMVKNANLIDLAGIKYLPCQYIPERADRLEKVGNLCINKNYYPRVFFVDNFIVAKDDQDALAKLNSDEVQPRQVVVLEDNPAIPISDEIDEVEPRQSHQTQQNVEIIDASPGFWELSTQNNSDSFLVFSQTNYPGWQARIDSQDTKIYQADYLFQAIFVPAGKHEITLQFDSKPLKLGAILTIIGLIIILTTIIFAIFEKKLKLAWERYYPS